MRLLDRLTQRSSFPGLSFDDYLQFFSYNGNTYPILGNQSMPGTPRVDIANDFEGYVQQIHNRSGVVAAAVTARALLLSELRFKWRAVQDGNLFGDQSLLPLERPGTMTRPELLALAEHHVSYGGNAYFHRDVNGRVRLLRPDWVTVVLASNDEPDNPSWGADAEVVAYIYQPGGKQAHATPVALGPTEVAHWKPEPDPANPWRGLSWVQSVLLEISTDIQASQHLAKFYEHAATPNLIFSFDKDLSSEQVKTYAEMIQKRHSGTANAYRNMVLGGGADVQVVGANLQQLDYKNTQGGHETRVASRARVPAVILGLREGMQGSSLNAGNYSSTRRMWADGWFSPTANGLCATLETIVPPPTGAELSHDPSAVMFLQEDRKDEAEIKQANAVTMRQLVESGYAPDSVTEAVVTGDFTKLRHSGLYSVQLQEAGAQPTENP